MIEHVAVRRGEYHDSVRLMQVGRTLLQLPGVEDALVAMATDLNRELLADLGFDTSVVAEPTANDLLVAIRGTSQEALENAERRLEVELAPTVAPTRGPTALPVPHTIEAAAAAGRANLAIVSVPGPHAFVEAMAAVRSGLHVMVFSDNVPVDQEVRLKEEAAARDLLVMGPDCGTAIVHGVGLGFTNAVEPGPVAIVGASGTGIQQLCCLLADAGVGIRHALGTGSNDLSAEVGAASTLRAFAALDADPGVEAIVVVSKPPAPEVAAQVREATQTAATPFVLALLGEPGVTLEGAATEVLGHLGRPAVDASAWPRIDGREHRHGALRGLFSGGTLRDEARSIAETELGTVAVEPSAPGHTLVDFGADEYTRGRAHPMIDQRIRLEHLATFAADLETGVILLDVVLGYGAHPDPAPELAPAIADAVRNDVAVVVSLCGTRADPQDRDRQAALLHETGASVFLSNAAAAREATRLAKGAP